VLRELLQLQHQGQGELRVPVVLRATVWRQVLRDTLPTDDVDKSAAICVAVTACVVVEHMRLYNLLLRGVWCGTLSQHVCSPALNSVAPSV
jgi:hypothetical protein